MIYYMNDLSCNNITIQHAQDVGSAYIVSVPSGAKIYIDNVEQVGLITPATVNNIPSIPAAHTYKLTRSGYMDAEGILFITTGETYNVTVMLCRPPTDMLPILAGFALTGIFLVMSRRERLKGEKPKLKQEEGLIRREGKLKEERLLRREGKLKV